MVKTENQHFSCLFTNWKLYLTKEKDWGAAISRLNGSMNSKKTGVLETYALFAATAVCFLAVFSPTFPFLYKEWLMDEYSHSFLIVPLAALMFWAKLTGWKSEAKPSVWGPILIGFALFCLALSTLSTFRQLSYVALYLVIVGLTLTYFGRATMKRTAPAFVFLLFAVPLPFMVYNALALHMKLLSSDLGVLVLQFLRIPVFQDGNVIDLGSYKLQVADACSGLRYLFPVTSFAYLIAYLLEDRLWKRIVLFFSAIPVSIAMNALRIAFVGVTVDVWGPGAVDEVLHFFEGYVVFALCIGLLALEANLLLRLKPRGWVQWDRLDFSKKTVAIRPVLSGPFATAAFLLLLGASAFTLFSTPSERAGQPLTKSLATFPLSIGSWTGKPTALERNVLKELALSDYWNADYLTPSGQNVNLYIAYYDRQKIGSAVHSPETCLPGGGWKIKNEQTISQSIDDKAPPFPMKRIQASDGNQTILIYYWFDERGHKMTSQFEAKWHLMMDSLLSGRTDGALIRLSTPLSPDEKMGEADGRLQSFLKNVYPEISQFLPRAK